MKPWQRRREPCWAQKEANEQRIRELEEDIKVLTQRGLERETDLDRWEALCHLYPLSTSRNQVLVQSQCSCRFLVGSTGKPFKNRLLFHRLESQYRARSYVTEYVSCFVSLARPWQRQTQQTCSKCISATQTDRSIGTQHTKAPRERSKSIKSHLLSSRSRSTPMPHSADPSRTSLNKLSTMADFALLWMFMALRTYIGIQTRRIQRVRI